MDETNQVMPKADDVQGRWLIDFLERSSQSKQCMTFGCSTCGSHSFLKILLSAIPSSSSGNARSLDASAAVKLLRALRDIESPDHYSFPIVAPISFILCILRYQVQISLAGLQEALLGCWAGERLATMKRHHESVTEQQRAHAEYSSPESAEQRRSERKLIANDRHQNRVQHHRKRGQLWLAARRTT